MENEQNVFEGYRVIELASVLAGPSVGQFFAELGAEVIKIENPATKGDVTRQWKLASEDPDTERSAYFTSVNWGKKSIGLDLNQEEGRQLVYRLVEKSDILISSYKPGDDRKLGMDYPRLKAINPGLIYGQISGYGDENERTGYDAIVQAETGYMFMNGVPGGENVKMPVALIDVLAAHHLKEAILIALLQKAKTGKGIKVSVSLFDAAISSLTNQAANYLVAGHNPQKMGSGHPNIVPYGNAFVCADGRSIVLAVGNDQQFSRLAAIIGLPELASNPMFVANKQRVANRQQLLPLLQQAIQSIQSQYLHQQCLAQNIPAGKINSVKELFDNEAVDHALMHDISGTFSQPGLKQYIAKREGEKQRSHFLPPPHFCAHTAEILSDVLGMSSAEIKQLKDKSLIY